MKLLTQEVKTKLPPLYSQEDKGGKAIAHVKFFTPDSSWTWCATLCRAPHKELRVFVSRSRHKGSLGLNRGGCYLGF